MKIHIKSSRLFTWVLTTVAVLALSSCVSREHLVLFQDANEYQDPKRIASTFDIRIQSDDQLAISIASQTKELVDVFNNKTLIGSGSGSAGGSMGSSSGSGNTNLTAFHVDKDGYIEFPVFGRIYVEGLSRKALADTIQNRLRSGYVNDAVVSVELLSFHVVIVGPSKTSTILTLDKDRCTIIEAITMAGGFPTGSYRENVLVIREENGEIWTTRVDFTKLSDLLNSPVYYLQQNDIIYIEGNGASSVDESATYKYITATSTIASFLVSMAAIIMAAF